ncbi:ABC transporter ATP-binding protein [Dongia soli]|uniref:ABC transporter ATP-binding protein n=1 Tax=Dongia soli TaxID=600628 RepID=A0ABU5EGV7_9PROT|nr:ABC transporter ATP-binding protein [Dongia soli]MDY0885473.1 ABC transporter ATP-binding protein [Dongia soli]
MSDESTTGRSSILQLRQLTKSFGNFTAVDRIDLDIAEGEFFTIVGPSGSGKTTLLRMLTGMETPSGGDILLRGKRINDLPANRRPTCMVFQSLALFPHRTVGQNIEFPLKIRGVDAASRKARALQLLDQLRLPQDHYGKSVTKCSGGERQRVALARALAYNPEILFFDEPLSAIDYKLRKTLEKELKDIHRETGKTFIYITHSLEEAMVMSDRIGVMRAGHLVQVGTPHEIYTAPQSKFVSEFIGDVNVIAVQAQANGQLHAAEFGTSFAPPRLPNGFTSGHLVVRPEFLRFLDRPDSAVNCLEGRLYNEYALGSRIQYQVRVGEHVFIVEKLRQQAFGGQRDDAVLIGWDAKDSILVAE